MPACPIDRSSPRAAAHAGLKSAPARRFKSTEFRDDVSAVAPDDPSPPCGADRERLLLAGSILPGGGLFLEKGVASWYGKMFHGRKTSSGDTYDMYAMTAAHPSLPIPSYVRVTNLANGLGGGAGERPRPLPSGPHHRSLLRCGLQAGLHRPGPCPGRVALVLPEDVAFVQPGRPVPPIRRARRRPPGAGGGRQQPAPAPARGGAQRPVRRRPNRPGCNGAGSAVPVPASRPAERVGRVFLQLGAFGPPDCRALQELRRA
jgi:hypothetical protein